MEIGMLNFLSWIIGYCTALMEESHFSILYFKGLGLRNLQYEIRICQKRDDKVTKTVYVWFEFLWI